MELIFNKAEDTIGWLNEDIIYDLTGNAAAFIKDKSVSPYECAYRVIFDTGFFRDLEGRDVAFIKGASGGPFSPFLNVRLLNLYFITSRKIYYAFLSITSLKYAYLVGFNFR